MSDGGWLYYVLLLMAVISGWMLGRIRDWKFLRRFESRNTFTRDYFVGLNYLLHDEPDEAVDTFINALELNADTIETHLALGILLRRRGKVDKAIEVHQGLLTGNELTESHSQSIRLELARDFTAGGVLDRAERILQEIVSENSVYKWEALSQLIVIYQMSKEWAKAEAAARDLLVSPRHCKQQSLRSAASHFCCELAREAAKKEDSFKVRRWLAKAWSYDRDNLRPALMLASTEAGAGNHRRAARILMKAVSRNVRHLAEVVGPLTESMLAIDAADELETFLRQAVERQASTAAALQSAELIKRRAGVAEATSFLMEFERRHPTLRGLTGFSAFMVATSEGVHKERANLLHDLLVRTSEGNPLYHCEGCGFAARKLFWLCPGCQQWGLIVPITGAEGD